MPVETLYKGENHLLKRNLLQEDGVSPLPVSGASSVVARIFQDGNEVVAYTHGTSPELTTNPSISNQLRLELSVTLTLSLAVGDLTIRWEVAVANTDFAVSSGLAKDIWEEVPFKIK